jgi:Spy/CpxP family protein refolding chaperone
MKHYITILLVCFGLFAGIAQNGGREKIKKLKIAYFTENLDLTTEEAQQFWPVYNAYDDKNHELRVIGLNKIKREIKQRSSMSEADAAKILDKIQAIEKQVYENGVNLINKLREFLPAVKIIKLKKAERDFNRDLMKRFRDRRGRRKSMP